MEIIPFNQQFNNNIGEFPGAYSESSDEFMVEALSRRFTDELKRAKREYLACGEVLLPSDLTKALAKDVFDLAEAEPYGLKGCTVVINFEGHENDTKKLGVINIDPTTPSTCELYLTLRQAANGWNNFLPQFLKKMTRGGTVMISPEYELTKRKLYRSYDD